MFEDIYRMLDAVESEANYQVKRLPKSFHSLIPMIEFSLAAGLVEKAIEAMNTTPEYSAAEAEPLRDRLIENLSSVAGDGRPVHAKVSEDGKVTIFDRQFAGTASDFAQAKYPSTRSPSLRHRFWKYGIYMRDVEGNYQPSTVGWFNKAVDKLP